MEKGNDDESSLLVKITVLGAGGCGKTALTIQLVSHHFVEAYDPTIESCYRQQFVVDGEVAMLDILDTAGQDDYSALRTSWIRGGEGFLIVYSITDRTTFLEAQEYFNLVRRVQEEDALLKARMAVVLAGNKVDLEAQRRVPTADGMELATKWSVDFFETSAKTRHNLQEAFFQLVRRVRERRSTRVAAGGGSAGSGSKSNSGSQRGKRSRSLCVLL